MHSALKEFHPAVGSWFAETFGEPTEPQSMGWPRIRQGEDVLIAAPTGSGKTLAAFLCAIDGLVQRGMAGSVENRIQVLYVSPLKALANDIRTNLLVPLKGVRQKGGAMGIELPEIRALVRTGDTPAKDRRKMIDQPPHILVTTPESLYILLTSRSGREALESIQTVIVDEIHALARDKRGSHLTLSLERLEALVERPPQRIGLSATQKPIEDMARFLVGDRPPARIVDIGHRREMDLGILAPADELGAVASHSLWDGIYDRIAQLALEHRTTLIFVNTRRLAERVTHHLAERLGEDTVAAHHGSLSKDIRLDAESRLKQGSLRAIVATASLELGIDIGTVDLVCQIGTPRSIALALQRVGRAGHWKGAIPKGRLIPLSRDDLAECAALVRAIRQGTLDRILVPECPLDVLAQQIVAEASCREWLEDELYDRFRKAAPYRALERKDFDDLIAMLSEGTTTRRGRRGVFLHRDRVNGRIKGRRRASLAALTSGGAIPEVANYLVKADPDEITVGTLDEDFAVESSKGDIFLLGNTSWKIRRVESGVVRVEDAKGAPPTVPFWLGEAPQRTAELSRALSDLRKDIAALPDQEAQRLARQECGCCPAGALQLVRYIQAGVRALGAVPSSDCVVAERFFDESGGMQLILHAPLGGRLNKAWGLGLRKKFCRSFNFELQAAATDNGINISLSDQHSFPLDAVFQFLASPTVRDIVVQAMLDVPVFPIRWRWNVGRALQVLRFEKGGKVPPPLQRMRSDDLLAAVFPDSAACLENIVGDIEVPDHPLVKQTVHDCLTEAMDIAGLTELVRGIEEGKIRCVAIDTPEPSPFSHEILNANPWAYLDDAPLEERRARAVQTRRTLPDDAAEMGVLDARAIQQVIEEARPPLRDADEVHDAVLTLAAMPEEDLLAQRDSVEDLRGQRRLLLLTPRPDVRRLLVAAERAFLSSQCYPEGIFEPVFDPSSQEALRVGWERDRGLDRDSALRELLRAHLECSGPVTVQEIAERLSLESRDVERALLAVESQGQILRGRFRPEAHGTEWCDRRLLARIHSLTLARLRREIEPASPADFMRFLLRWQYAAPGTRQHGEAGLAQVLDRLPGLEIPASAWESAVLPLRMAEYLPEDLERLCLSGRFSWGRLSGLPAAGDDEGDGARRPPRPTRAAPITFFRREDLGHLAALRNGAANGAEGRLSSAAEAVREHLRRWGACFTDDLTRTTGLLPSQVEEALWELVATGLATADGFDNLRALIDPLRRRGPHSKWARRRGGPVNPTGRWTLLRLPGVDEARDFPSPGSADMPVGISQSAPRPPEDSTGVQREGTKAGSQQSQSPDPESLDWLARTLLKRWGVVFRDLLQRESVRLPWRELLWTYRRLEARGEIRGGRFVSGFVGEQFALPEAVESLRAVRRSKPDGTTVAISAADPLNLTGILLPGPRVRPHPKTVLRLRDGVVLDDEPSPLMARLMAGVPRA